MLLVPPEMPVISPVSESTLTIAGLLDAQVPPVGVPESVVELPSQTSSVPEIVGAAFIVTIAVLLHPAARLYVISDVPAVTPVIIPFADPTVATEVAAEVQVPPDTVFVNIVEAPAQTVNVPPIADGV